MHTLKRVDGDPIVGRLVYRRSDRGLDVEPHPQEGVASLLVNDAQIELDEEAHLMYVWGYCPHESWKPSKLNAPTGSPGRILFLGEAVIPGVSTRLNDQRWPSLFDESSGWLCIGDPSSPGDAVEFSPGAIAVLRDGKLQALWLRPDIQAESLRAGASPH